MLFYLLSTVAWTLSVTSMWISYLSIIVYNVFVSLHSVILVWKQVSGKIGFFTEKKQQMLLLDICPLFYIILRLTVHWALSLRNVFYWGNTITWPLLNPNWAMKWELFTFNQSYFCEVFNGMIIGEEKMLFPALKTIKDIFN